MKLTRDHYNTLRYGIEQLLLNNHTTVEKEREYYTNNNIGKDHNKRMRWDFLYMAGLSNFIVREVYSYANDSHVDTALKNIVKGLSV